MRKFVALFTLVLLAATSIVIAINHAPKIDIRVQETKGDLTSSPTDILSAEIDDTAFDQSTHGLGWCVGDNRKIDLDVATGNFGTIFRKKHDDGSGTMGGLAGTWGDYETMYLYPGNIGSGGRYPSTSTYNGYHFGVFGRYNGTGNPAEAEGKLLVYSIEDEEWTEAFNIISPDGVKPSGVWSPLISTTYDESTGNYVAGVTLEVYGLESADARTTSIVVGKSATPADTASWTWTDCTDYEFSAGGNVDEAGKIKIGWGKTDKNFGCAVSIQKIGGSENYHLSYLRTDDFGENWALNGDTFFSVSSADIFPWYGTMYTPEGGEPAEINDVGMSATFDVMGSNNDEIHVLTWVYAQTDANITRENDDGVPTSGWYNIIGTRDGNGLMTWTPYFIAHKAGWQDVIGGYENTFEGKYINRYSPSLGYSTDGMLVASWLDRPIENGPGSVIEAANAGPGLTATSTRFVDDAYVSTSTTGRYWEVDEFRRATNVTNTVDLHEECWTISGNVISLGNNEYELYAAHQYADFDILSYQTAEDFSNFEQNLHVWKLGGPGNNIQGEDISLTKEFNLSQNYPNPFNPTTSINFILKNSGKVNLSVYNTKGEVVSVLANEQMNSGSQSFSFDATNFNSGVYFYQLSVNGVTESKKMVLTK